MRKNCFQKKKIHHYTAHPHDMVHVPAKFRENTLMSFWVTVRKLNVTDRRMDGRTDRQTDGGRCNISRPGPSAPWEIKTWNEKNKKFYKKYSTKKIKNLTKKSWKVQTTSHQYKKQADQNGLGPPPPKILGI